MHSEDRQIVACYLFENSSYMFEYLISVIWEVFVIVPVFPSDMHKELNLLFILYVLG